MSIPEAFAAAHHWTRVAPITEGWSGEEKYHVYGRDDSEYLLRVADVKASKPLLLGFEGLRRLGELPVPADHPGPDGLPVPLAVESGALSDRAYALLSWLPGTSMETALPALSERRQYALGVRAGRVLRRIHAIPAPPETRPWSERFGAKIERKLAAYASCPLHYEHDEALLACVRAGGALLDDSAQVFQHGDYHVGNMLLMPDGDLGVIDFNRADWGDPWEEFNRVVWSAQASPAFASGQVYGYFDGHVPERFWQQLRLYIGVNALSALPWAISYGESEIATMRAQTQEIMDWYDSFSAEIPSWYAPPRFPVDRGALHCRISPSGAWKDYAYVIVLSRHRGKYLLSRHRERDAWECQGGHIEPGETPLEAARRELYEEAGARAGLLEPLCDYLGWDDLNAAPGKVFRAEIDELGPLPDSEMAEARLFDRLPEALVYPGVIPQLFQWLESRFP